VLPGGLTRVSTADKSLVVSMQQGGGSKDTWVLGPEKTKDDEDAAAAVTGHHRPAAPANFPAAPPTICSGWAVTPNAWKTMSGWRALCCPGSPARRTSDARHRSKPSPQLLANMGYLAEEFPSSSLAQQRWQLQRLLTGMVYDPSRSTGIGWNLKQIRRVAWPLKERLSQDTWRVLQQLDMEFSTAAPATPIRLS
jgi:hypothetical protein